MRNTGGPMRRHSAYGFATPALPNATRPDPRHVLNNVTLRPLPGSILVADAVSNRYRTADSYRKTSSQRSQRSSPADIPAQPGLCLRLLPLSQRQKIRPENADVTSLAYEYFAVGGDHFMTVPGTSDPRKANTGLMTRFAQMMKDEEIKAAAQYFTAISATPWITVGERATVPKTKPENGMFLALEGDEFGFEPIGERIIETPEKTHDSEFLRNPRSGFIAYVPPGSLEKGAALVLNGITTDGSKITACTVCHGGDLGSSCTNACRTLA